MNDGLHILYTQISLSWLYIGKENALLPSETRARDPSATQANHQDASHTPACTLGGLLVASPQSAEPRACPASVLGSERI